MTAKDRKHQANCPFWSAVSTKCSICNSGLFIPLDNHTDVFCKTPRYSACMQYILYSENQIFLLEKVRKSEENRRKFLRFQNSRAITLIKIFGSGNLSAKISSEAQTIDVSKSGMRVATEKPLRHDATVQFSIDKSFPLGVHEVTGQVEWCNKQVDEPGYHVGLSFQGNHIIEAMERYLEHQHGQN